MKKDNYFDRIFGPGWPSLAQLAPYFLAKPGREWFYASGNNGASLSLESIDGTDHLPRFEGRIGIRLSMWGNPDHGVLLLYTKAGGGNREDYTSKGDLKRLKEWGTYAA
jgi:hypothetical protein